MFKPLNNRVLVKEYNPEKERISKLGIILKDDDKEIPSTGIVVVGNKDVKEGDKIVFSKFGYDEVEIDKEKYFVVSDFNIIGKFV